MSIEPDTKDWTWVLTRPCSECGFDAPTLDLARVGQAIRDNANLWQVVLGIDDAAVRPQQNIWSPLEYACHVRDVNRLFAQRVRRMLEERAPRFADWDQDAAAEDDDYGSQDPATVGEQVVASAEEAAALYEAVTPDQWERTGSRSDGSDFTVDTFARYHVHDVVHHAHDVSHITKRITIDSYNHFSGEYTENTREMAPEVQAAIDSLAADLGAGARVLEIGSGPGRDAEALEAAGLSVRRTDITPAFVTTLRASGRPADVLDPLTNDLRDPERDAPYDGVYASASLLHVRREDLPTVLERLAEVTRQGGLLHLAVKEGDGARFSTHGSVQAPRHFTFWREEPLRDVLTATGWTVTAVGRDVDKRDTPWLAVRATRD